MSLDGEGEETRIVGGAVRNALMGLPVTEIDLASTALPNEVTRRAELAGFKAVPTGIEHGTVTVVLRRTPFRGDDACARTSRRTAVAPWCASGAASRPMRCGAISP